MKSSFYGILALSLFLACISGAETKPALVPAPGQWTLDTEFTHPKQILFRRAEDNEIVRYWYIILTLTNNTGQDVGFYPKCELGTDTFQIIPAGTKVGSIIFEKIKERHESEFPFLELLGRADNKMLQGEDNTKDLALIWPDFDPEANEINIFVSGLSNETAILEYPVDGNQNSEIKTIYLRKTLNIEYDVKGDPKSANGAQLEYQKKSWVMR